MEDDFGGGGSVYNCGLFVCDKRKDMRLVCLWNYLECLFRVF